MKLFYVEFDSEYSNRWVVANNFTHAEQIIDRWRSNNTHRLFVVRTIKLVDDKLLREEDLS